MLKRLLELPKKAVHLSVLALVCTISLGLASCTTVSSPPSHQNDAYIPASGPYSTPNYPAPAQGTNPSDRYSIKQDRGSSVPINPDHIPDVIPQAEPYSAAGNKSPYTVLGQTYRVLPSAKGYRAEGVASWYGAKFHGHKTSNGETFSIYEMSAAHKTLPIPCYARVTNLGNGKSVIVRVNDRGPFKHGRLIDLSEAAATKLGYASQGTANVRVEILDTVSPNTTANPSATTYSPSAKEGPFYLQVGAFGNPDNARSQKAKLTSLFSHPVIVSQIPDRQIWRVKIGPVSTQHQALKIQQEVVEAGLGRAVLVSP